MERFFGFIAGNKGTFMIKDITHKNNISQLLIIRKTDT